MPAGMIDSQLETLERPERAIVVSVDQPIEDAVACIIQAIGSLGE